MPALNGVPFAPQSKKKPFFLSLEDMLQCSSVSHYRFNWAIDGWDVDDI